MHAEWETRRLGFAVCIRSSPVSFLLPRTLRGSRIRGLALGTQPLFLLSGQPLLARAHLQNHTIGCCSSPSTSTCHTCHIVVDRTLQIGLTHGHQSHSAERSSLSGTTCVPAAA